ncbi:MAG: dihydrofolate reductase [Pseudomonadota bacterium]
MTRPTIILIAAVASNNVIGSVGSMPWRIKSDMRHFRAATMGKPVIVGRKTYESIGGALDGRSNIVISRSGPFDGEDVLFATSVDAALDLAEEEAVRLDASEIYVIGGGEIYALTLEHADRLEITEIAAHPDGDTYFPEIDPEFWNLVSREPLDSHESDTVSAQLAVYVRKEPPLRA